MPVGHRDIMVQAAWDMPRLAVAELEEKVVLKGQLAGLGVMVNSKIRNSVRNIEEKREVQRGPTQHGWGIRKTYLCGCG